MLDEIKDAHKEHKHVEEINDVYEQVEGLEDEVEETEEWKEECEDFVEYIYSQEVLYMNSESNVLSYILEAIIESGTEWLDEAHEELLEY